MANSVPALNTNGVGTTQRKDNWWLEPLLTLIGLGGFGVYSMTRAFEGNFYEWGPYLSPFYSPKILLDWWPFSPAFLILWAPLGFRATCYYYRKAYYRAFFWDPPACAVGEPRGKSYKGETAFPFIFQNIHRYFFYIAALFIVMLAWDALQAFNFDGQFGVGVGSIVMTLNVIFLGLYTFSCHSWRHLVGGNIDCFSCPKNPSVGNYSIWSRVSLLNEHHMLWAWISLFTVGLTDFYIRQVSAGAIPDVRLF